MDKASVGEDPLDDRKPITVRRRFFDDTLFPGGIQFGLKDADSKFCDQRVKRFAVDPRVDPTPPGGEEPLNATRSREARMARNGDSRV